MVLEIKFRVFHMYTGRVFTASTVLVVSFLIPDPTKVMVPPSSMDVTVGESIVLPCQVTHDHSLDIVFTWTFNGHLIDFDKDGDHFERVGGVSINVILSIVHNKPKVLQTDTN